MIMEDFFDLLFDIELFPIWFGYMVFPICIITIIIMIILKNKDYSYKICQKILLWETMIPVISIIFRGIYGFFLGSGIVSGWNEKAYGITGGILSVLVTFFYLIPPLIFSGIIALYVYYKNRKIKIKNNKKI